MTDMEMRLRTHAPPEVVAAATRLMAGGWATPERLAKVLSPLLEQAPAASVVLRLLEEGAAAAGAAATPARVEQVAASLVAVGARIQVAGCPGYPAKLADVWPDRGAPAWVAVRSPTGTLAEGPAVAIVGTRHPTLDGVRTATELARLLARNRVTVVSGMARGIDQAAHRGALEAGGATVAVLGAGFDVDYPRGDRALREAIAGSGGLVTELAPDARPAPRNFLERNRIISGLADVVVVVEGRARSGAQQTARLAAAQGRDVWAVPGSINAPTSRAPLDLIRDGASVVTRLEDVLEAITPGVLFPPHAAGGGPGVADLEPPARRVLAVLGAAPAAPGALARAVALPLPVVLAAVAELTGRGLAATTARGVVRA